MNITRWAIENNRVTIAAVLSLVFSGMAAYVALPKAQDPGFTIRSALVTTRFPGASPQRVEELVTDTLEERIQEMPELDEVTSDSRAGLSVITVSFKDSYDDMQPIFDDLRTKVENAANDLPNGATMPFVNDEFGDTYGHIYSLYGDGFSRAELRDYALDVRNTLLLEGDVAKVELYGDVEETIYIEYDNTRLTELGVSPQQLESTLLSLNILSSGGDITVGRERIQLEPTGNLDTLADLSAAIIQIPGSDSLIQLGDIATITRAYEDPVDELVRVDGHDAISLAISLREGGNLLTLGDRLAELMPQLESGFPLGIELKPMFVQSQLTGQSVDDFVSNLVQAVIIVIVVMVLSLGLRTGLVVAALIPSVMISTFMVMAQFGIGIDRISLAALIIALGLLVDNAIVVVEATIVRREAGESAIDAAVAAAGEMMGPLLISSLTTAAAFTPIALAESAVGEFTASIFYVVTIALLISWVLSMTFIPMLTPFITVDTSAAATNSDPYDTPLYDRYRGILMLALRNRLVFGVMVIALFMLAMYGMRYVPNVFIPPSEDPHLTVTLELPPGTAIESTAAAIEAFENHVFNELFASGDDPEAIGITGWTAYVGTGGPRFVLAFNPANPNEANATMIVNVNNSASLSPMKSAMERYFYDEHPDMQVQVKRLANGPPVTYPIEVKLTGESFNELFALSGEVRDLFWQDARVTAISDSWGPQSKKLIIDIDQARAFRSSVTNQDIATSLNASLSGLQLSEFREGDDVIPIVLRTTASDRNDLSKLDNLTVFSQSAGVAVPLSQVAAANVVWEPARIKRLDRKRMLTVQVQLAPDITAAEVMQDLRPRLAEMSAGWPPGYSYTEGGETDESNEAMGSIVDALPFGCIGIVMLLMLQFNSFRRTTIVLVTIPLGLIGITAGLLIAQSVFGFFTFLGLISLAGIVINNAIVLLDRVKLEIEENGLAPADAVVSAAVQRARPILLTTATTIGGMIPLWLGGGPMFEPMAVAILFGLLFATFITLLLVPVLYSALFGLRYGSARTA